MQRYRYQNLNYFYGTLQRGWLDLEEISVYSLLIRSQSLDLIKNFSRELAYFFLPFISVNACARKSWARDNEVEG